VSSTGSDPTTTFVVAAEAVAELLTEALLDGLAAAVLELLLELLQAVTRIAATARVAAVTGTRLA
jgi:DNA-binding phage protein